jgi:preprotein translocase subunit SecY
MSIQKLVAGFTLQSLYKLTELRDRLLFTICMIAIYRITTYIPLPGIVLDRAFAGGMEFQNSYLSMINSWCGGATQNAAVASLGVMPYITASIVIQLLSLTSPEWAALKKEGDAGRAIMNQYTKYLALLFCVTHGSIMIGVMQNHGLIYELSPFFVFNTILSLATTTMFLIWLGEQIKKMGIGEGISMILCANLLSQLPAGVVQVLDAGRTGTIPAPALTMFVVFFVAALMFVAFIESSQRRIPLICPKRMQTHIKQEDMFVPVKVNTAGITPIIFAQVITQLFSGGLSGTVWILEYFEIASNPLLGYASTIQAIYTLLLTISTIFFSIIYVPMVFSPEETADNLHKQGSFIVGVQPGAPTAQFFEDLLFRLGAIGGVYLSIVTLLPGIVCQYFFYGLAFSGTSLLIVVNVLMETMTQISTHIISAQYKALIRSDQLRAQSLMKRLKHHGGKRR